MSGDIRLDDGLWYSARELSAIVRMRTKERLAKESLREKARAVVDARTSCYAPDDSQLANPLDYAIYELSEELERGAREVKCVICANCNASSPISTTYFTDGGNAMCKLCAPTWWRLKLEREELEK